VTVLFVSDIHLGDSDERRYKLFMSLLDQLILTPPSSLVLLGDIFDLWVGRHSYFLEKHAALLDKLDQLASKKCEIHYFEGNHDLYLGRYFGKKDGFLVHPNSYTVNWAGNTIRMEHGDLANPNDKGYLFLRAFLRNPVIRFILNHIPGSWVKSLGEKASEASRKYTDQFDEDAVEVIRSYAKSLATKDNFDYLITGHTHQRDEFEFLQGDRKVKSINLGSWFSEEISVLTLKEGELKFVPLKSLLDNSDS
jgi:UDP-2,3-diacylglucosamine hydrolase